MNNLDFWDRFAQPPPQVLTPIIGGRLKGKTDIKPQWRLKVMTEVFGPVGTGWNYQIVKTWTEQGSYEQVCVFVEVAVTYKTDEGKWSEPVTGIGGAFLIEKEKAGLHTDDDAYKKAVTDALSVALKALGVAANIYLGLGSESKYDDESRGSVNESPEANRPSSETEPPEENKAALRRISGRLIDAKNTGLLTVKEFDGWKKRAIEVVGNAGQLKNIGGLIDKLIGERTGGQDG